MSTSKGMHTYKEILSQGEIWPNVIKNVEIQMESVKDWAKKEHDEVIFIGCGSTYYLSLTAAKIWTAITKESARAMPSSDVWYYSDSAFSKQKPLMVAVSRSGETTETINAINSFKKIVWGQCSCCELLS